MPELNQTLTFDQAVSLAMDLVPGLRNDMALLAKMRKETPRDMEGIGRIALNIPDPIEPILRAYHPELYQGDAALRGEAWLRFIKHPHSERFRVHSKGAKA